VTDPLSVTPVKYYGADPDTIFQEISDDMRTLFPDEWGSTLENGHGRMLLYLFARALWRVSFQANFAAGESVRGGVKTRRSASRIAKQLGYNPRGASSASAVLSVSLGATYGFDVPMPAGFQFNGPGGTIWSTSQAYEWTSGTMTAKSITATEGVTRSTALTSDGSKNQQYPIPINRSLGEYLKHNGLVVKVAGVTWTEYDTIPPTATDAYEVTYVTDPPSILFGNGGSGNVPPSSAYIEIAYVVSLGKAGNIQSGQITEPTSPLVIDATTIDLVISQPTRATGGLSDEDIDTIVANATDSWKSRSVAVTTADFAAVAMTVNDERYGRAASVVAHSPRGAGGDAKLTTLLDAARTALSTPSATVETQAALITAALALLTEAGDDVTVFTSEIGTYVTALAAELVTARTSLLSSLTYLSVIVAHLTQLSTELSAAIASTSAFESVTIMLDGSVAVVNGNTAITGTATTLSTDLAAGDIVTIGAGESRIISTAPTATTATVTQAFTASVSGQSIYRTRRQGTYGALTTLDSRLQKAASLLSLISSAAGTASSDVNLVATDIADMTTISTDMATAVAAFPPIQATAAAQTVVIEDAVAALVAATAGIEIAHEAALQGVYDHVDLFLAQDCTANIVQLLVLSRDTDGFLSAPSVGLLAAIETDVRAVSEPQTVVEAVSGESQLVTPTLTVIGTYKSGRQRTDAEAEVTKAIRDHVKTLTWGDGLWYEEVYRAVTDLTNADRLTVSITGPTAHMDANGNIDLPTSFAFTAPTVTVTLTEA
jgi:hypothetical protein